MVWKRLKQLVIGGVVLAALALDSSASAGAATDSSGSSLTVAAVQASSNGGPPALSATRAPRTARGGSAGAIHRVRDGWIRDPYLTDHEQYVRHHRRLASAA